MIRFSWPYLHRFACGEENCLHDDAAKGWVGSRVARLICGVLFF